MTNLTTLTKVKAVLGITDTSKDAILADLITQASTLIQTVLGRDLEAKERTEILDRPDGDNLFLRYYPIIDTEPLTAYYRTGQVGSPTWVAYTTNDYYVYAGEGYLKFVNTFAEDFQGEYQAYKVTYTGGYLIDFANEGDPTLHTLPADLTLVATQLVVSAYNKRASVGIVSETTEGQSITYGGVSESDFTATQKAVLRAYKRILI